MARRNLWSLILLHAGYMAAASKSKPARAEESILSPCGWELAHHSICAQKSDFVNCLACVDKYWKHLQVIQAKAPNRKKSNCTEKPLLVRFCTQTHLLAEVMKSHPEFRDELDVLKKARNAGKVNGRAPASDMTLKDHAKVYVIKHKKVVQFALCGAAAGLVIAGTALAIRTARHISIGIARKRRSRGPPDELEFTQGLDEEVLV